jgi:hypothetical protein
MKQNAINDVGFTHVTTEPAKKMTNIEIKKIDHLASLVEAGKASRQGRRALACLCKKHGL